MHNHYYDDVEKCREVFISGRTKETIFRKNQLRALLKMLQQEKEVFLDILVKDLRKPRLEAVFAEMEIIINELQNVIWNITNWVKQESPRRVIGNIIDKVLIKNDPYGVVLIIGNWNYPLLSLLKPFIGAVAAGNCVILKPSEIASATANAFMTLFPQYLDSECYRIICGGPAETVELLYNKFDYIFFSGSYNTGKIIHEAANKFLVPTTLLLGGKNPTFIDDTVDMEITARRIISGKFVNCGQTCLAPDYIIISKQIENKFIEASKKVLKVFFGTDPRCSPHYGRIVSNSHYQRLVRLLETNQIVVGGRCDPNDLYIEPTIVRDVKEDNDIMKEEISGPILPIINAESPEEAIQIIKSGHRPLALYIFTHRSTITEKMLRETSSGTACVNDVIMQAHVENTPFGGVGMSGMGYYNDKCTFDLFTHKKTCLYKNVDSISELITSNRYPPYTERKINRLTSLLRKRNCFPLWWLKNYVIFFLGVAVAAAYYRYSGG